MKNSIESRASFDFIRYGAVWEDADILCQALAPVARGRRLLSIASAGGNALALLTLNPKEIVAVDLNKAQLACLELRIAAFRELSYTHLLAFMGVTESLTRLNDYQALRKHLSAWVQTFWDQRQDLVARGILHSGKLERFLRLYQWLLRTLVHSPVQISELLKPKNKKERLRFYHDTWNTLPWRLLNRLLFSRRVLGRLGRDPEFFRHAENDVSSGPERRLETALTQRSTHDNPYLCYQLTGNYSAAALPMFLRPEHFKSIRSRISRVTLFFGAAEDAGGKFSGFNLSNIFEYMAPDKHEQVYYALIKKAASGARLAYWNLHVKRSCPNSALAYVKPLNQLANKLHAIDKYWAYRSFHIDQVKGSLAKP